MSIEKAIVLLEKTLLPSVSQYEQLGLINQAIAELEPCKICGGSGRKPREKHCKIGLCVMQHEGITCHPEGIACIHFIPTEPCPACKDKPTEFANIKTGVAVLNEAEEIERLTSGGADD